MVRWVSHSLAIVEFFVFGAAQHHVACFVYIDATEAFAHATDFHVELLRAPFTENRRTDARRTRVGFPHDEADVMRNEP
jgi:hypothetical protein